jgi:hypothetical protein
VLKIIVDVSCIFAHIHSYKCKIHFYFEVLSFCFIYVYEAYHHIPSPPSPLVHTPPSTRTLLHCTYSTVLSFVIDSKVNVQRSFSKRVTPFEVTLKGVSCQIVCGQDLPVQG